MSLPDEYESIRLIDLKGFSPGAKVMIMKVMEEIRYRAMMGEHILYYRGKIVGAYMTTKKMLLVDDVDNKDFLSQLFNAMYEELPNPKKKKQ